MRRRGLRPPDLTSLFDVLFILVFVSLVNAGVTKHAADAAAAARATPTEPTAPAVPPSLAALRQAAVEVTSAQVRRAPLRVLHVAADGTATSLEDEQGVRALAVPLLEKVADPDVAVAYLGDRAPALQVCGVIARELRRADLAGEVVVIAPAVALAELPVALVAGLRRDVARCQDGQRALAVIVEPSAVPVGPGAP